MKNNRLIITLIALFLLGFGLKAQTASTEETAAQKEKRMGMVCPGQVRNLYPLGNLCRERSIRELVILQ